MKRNLLRVLLFFLLMSFFILSSTTMATNEVNTEAEGQNVLASYETNYTFASSDLVLFDANIEVTEIVDGNVFAYGGTVNVSGEIYGDLFVFANSLNISEDAIIHGNIFALSSTISFSGIVSDIYALSNSFTLEKDSIIARNLNIMSDTVSLSGQVSRDANIYTNSLTFADNSQEIIKGNLNYTSDTEATIADGLVTGEINYSPIQTDTKTQILNIVTRIISALLFAFAFIMLSIWIAPKFKDRLSEIISKKSLKAFGIGLLVFFGIIIAAFILLMFTYGFGSSIAVSAIGLLILVYSISNTVFSMSISKLITNKLNWNSNVSFVLMSLLFVLIIELIKYIPYVGAPIAFITAIIGLGMISINSYKRKDLVNS